MAVLELIGETGGGTTGILDVSSLRFAPVVSDLLPFGLAWDREDPVLRELINAEARELGRVDKGARNLLQELDPSKTYELLADWEEAYGLPECPGPLDSIESRRAALVAKLLAQAGHEQSKLYWESIFQQFGYVLEYVDLGPEIFSCIDDCQDILTDEGFAWLLATDEGSADGVLECFVAKNAPIWSFPILHFLWSEAASVDPAGTLRSIASNLKGYSVATGSAGATLYSAEDTNVWTAGYVAPFTINAVCEVDGKFYAVGNVGLNALLSDDGGVSWANLGLITDPLYAISRNDIEDTVVAVGPSGVIWTSSGGIIWFPVASPTAEDLFGIAQGSNSTMIAVGDNGVVIRSTDSGNSWSLVAPFTGLTLGAVSGFGQTFVAVSSGGAIFRSGDGGLSWDTITPATTEVLRGVVGSWTGRWTAVGDAGVILMSLDDGLTWEIQDSPTTEDLYAACAHYPDGRVLACGDNSVIVRE